MLYIDLIIPYDQLTACHLASFLSNLGVESACRSVKCGQVPIRCPILFFLTKFPHRSEGFKFLVSAAIIQLRTQARPRVALGRLGRRRRFRPPAPPPGSHPRPPPEPSAGCPAEGNDGGGWACSSPLLLPSLSLPEALPWCFMGRRAAAGFRPLCADPASPRPDPARRRAYPWRGGG